MLSFFICQCLIPLCPFVEHVFCTRCCAECLGTSREGRVTSPQQCWTVWRLHALKEVGNTRWLSGAEGGRMQTCLLYRGASIILCISLSPGWMRFVLFVYVLVCACVMCSCVCRMYVWCMSVDYMGYRYVCGVIYARVVACVWVGVIYVVRMCVWCVQCMWCVSCMWHVCYVACGVYVTWMCLWCWVGRHRECSHLACETWKSWARSRRNHGRQSLMFLVTIPQSPGSVAVWLWPEVQWPSPTWAAMLI